MSNNFEEKKSILMTSLIASGFLPESTEHTENGLILICKTTDNFGCNLLYIIGLPKGQFSNVFIKHLKRTATREGAQPILITSEYYDLIIDIATLTLDQFLARFGGGIKTLLPLEPDFKENFTSLGFNKLPEGLSGKADEHFENYVAAALEFLIGRKVIQYGQKRRGESVPDGIVISRDSYILFDAKAAKQGYEIDTTAIRQFSDYVNNFLSKYEKILGKAHSFLCISGKFKASEKVLIKRSDELYSKSGTRLALFDCNNVCNCINFFLDNLHLRQVTDWREVFSKTVILSKDVIRTAKSSQRDLIMGNS